MGFSSIDAANSASAQQRESDPESNSRAMLLDNLISEDELETVCSHFESESKPLWQIVLKTWPKRNRYDRPYQGIEIHRADNDKKPNSPCNRVASKESNQAVHNIRYQSAL